MKRKVVTAFLMAALGSSLVFSQAAMAAGTADKTENTAEAGTEEETEMQKLQMLQTLRIKMQKMKI